MPDLVLTQSRLTDTALHFPPGSKLNLGCGARKLDGYLNVDKFGDPDSLWDLEKTPWPWPSNSFDEVVASHVLEHLGQTTDAFLAIMKELYRVCRPGAKVFVVVPHPRHDFFLGDPTHVRAILPATLSLFSKRYCRMWDQDGSANSRLADYLDVDFDIGQIRMVPDHKYGPDGAEPITDAQALMRMERAQNNVVQEFQIDLEVIK